MGWILFTYLIVLAVSGFHQGVSALKPRMIPAVNEIVLQEGDDLIIQCEGNESLQFLTEEAPRNSALQYESSYDELSCLHQFVFKNVSFENTAWYACAEAGVYFKNNHQVIDHSSNDISWIYVYVNSTVPFPYESGANILHVHEGETAVIPCRPTSPDLSVKLQIDFEDIQDDQIPFVPKVGFLLANVNESLTMHGYSCQASIPDFQGSEPLIFLRIPTKDELPEPTIEEKSVRHVVWGKNHTFICNVIRPFEINFLLRWKTPPSVSSDRVFQKEVEPIYYWEDREDKVKYSVELTIRDVEKSDSGEYVCSVKRLDNEILQETAVNITVSNPNS